MKIFICLIIFWYRWWYHWYNDHVSWTKIEAMCRYIYPTPSMFQRYQLLGSLATHWAHSEDSDQTGRMPRLIWVFSGRSCNFVGFIMKRLSSVCSSTTAVWYNQNNTNNREWTNWFSVSQAIYWSHDTTKRVFGSFRPGQKPACAATEPS